MVGREEGSGRAKNRLQKEENLLSKCIWPLISHPTPAASAFEGEHFFIFFSETLKEVRVFGVDSGPVSINILII